MGSVLLRGMAAALLVFVVLLGGCGGPALERVDVTWETEPPPRWGLYPGSRQEIPCPPGASYRVDVIIKGQVYAKGTVRNAGHTLRFEPAKGGDLVVDDSSSLLTLDVLLPENKGQRVRRPALRIEREGDKIFFTVPK